MIDILSRMLIGFCVFVTILALLNFLGDYKDFLFTITHILIILFLCYGIGRIVSLLCGGLI